MKTAAFALILVFSAFTKNVAQEAAADSSAGLSHIQEILGSSTFTDVNGKAYSLKDFKGRAVVFHFWENRAGGSVKSMMELHQAQDKYGKDVVVIAVNIQSLDKSEQVKKFSIESVYNFVYVPGQELSQKLAVPKIPYKIFVNAEGHVVSSYSGAYPDVREFQRNLANIEKCIKK